MIITKSTPFSSEEINKLKEEFTTYVKTVIDVEKKICSAGCNRHSDSELLLLEKGSHQSSIWGGGIDLETKVIDFSSLINIRPSDNNNSNEVQDTATRNQYKELTDYFFRALYD